MQTTRRNRRPLVIAIVLAAIGPQATLLPGGLALAAKGVPAPTKEALGGKQFRFSWQTATKSSRIGIVTLQRDGTIGGIASPNENSWEIDDQQRLVFRNRDGAVSTFFTEAELRGGKWFFSGPLRLVSVQEHRDSVNRLVRRADVQVEIDGRPLDLVCGPYVMPTETAGLRIQADTTSAWPKKPPKRVQLSLHLHDVHAHGGYPSRSASPLPVLAPRQGPRANPGAVR